MIRRALRLQKASIACAARAGSCCVCLCRVCGQLPAHNNGLCRPGCGQHKGGRCFLPGAVPAFSASRPPASRLSAYGHLCAVACIRPPAAGCLSSWACCQPVWRLPQRGIPAVRFGPCPQPGGFCRTAPDMLAGVQFCLQPGSLAGRAPERLPEAQPGSLEPVQCKNAWGFKPYGLSLRASTAVFSFHSGRAAWCCRRACCLCHRQTAFLCCCGMLSGRRRQGVQQGV